MINKLNVEQWVKDEYKKWCKATNRGGGVLMGKSIIELLTHFAALTRQGEHEPTEAEQGEKHFDGFYCYEYDEGRTDDRCLFPCGVSWCGEAPKHYPQSYGDWVKFHEQTTSALHQQINDLKEQVKEKDRSIGYFKEHRDYLQEAHAKSHSHTSEFTALREELAKKQDIIDHQSKSIWLYSKQLSQVQDNYEKVWDAAIKRDYYEKYSAMELWKHLEIPSNKTTFINKIKKK
jgi:hypothetical protein